MEPDLSRTTARLSGVRRCFCRSAIALRSIFTTTSCGEPFQQDLTVRDQVQMQGFSGGQADSQTGRQTKDKECFFHTATVPDGGR